MHELRRSVFRCDWGNSCYREITVLDLLSSRDAINDYLQLHLLKLVYLLMSTPVCSKCTLHEWQGRDLDSLKWDSVKLLLRDLSGLQDLSYRNMVCSSAVYFCLALLAMPLTKLSSIASLRTLPGICFASWCSLLSAVPLKAVPAAAPRRRLTKLKLKTSVL